MQQRLGESDKEFEARKKRVQRTRRSLPMSMYMYKSGGHNGGAILPLIQYSFDTFRASAGVLTAINEGSGGKTYDATLFSGNHLYLGTGQSVDYPILNNGGANSYATYYDSDTKEFVKATLPVSTTYNMTKSHQVFFNHTKSLTANELAQLKAQPSLIADVWFNGKVLVDGFKKSDIGNFMMPIEGALGGAHVVDLSVPFGSEEFHDLRSNTFTVASIPNGYNVVSDGSGSAGNNSTFALLRNFDTTDLALFTFKVKTNSGVATSARAPYRWDLPAPGDMAQYENGPYQHLTHPTDIARKYIAFYLDGSHPFDIDIIDISLKEVTAYDIQNYTADCRSTLINKDYGIQNLLLKQDTAGIPTGAAATGTIAGGSDGRYIEVPTVPTKYLITDKCVDKMSGDDSTSLDIKVCPKE